MDIKKSYSKETTLTAQKVCQLLNNGKVNDLPLNVIQTIGSLTQTTLSGISIITELSSIMLDSNRVLVSALGTDNHYIYSVILTINGTTITAGTITATVNLSVSCVTMVLVDPTHVLLAYSYGQYIYGVILTINGTTISVGSQTQITSMLSPNTPSLASINSNHVLISYMGTANCYLYCAILTINGTTISVGSLTQINSLSTSSPSSVSFSTNQIL